MFWGFQWHEVKKVITARQGNCGKVMFSQVFVCSRRGGGISISSVRSLVRGGISGKRSFPEGGKCTWGKVSIQGVGIPRGLGLLPPHY